MQNARCSREQCRQEGPVQPVSVQPTRRLLTRAAASRLRQSVRALSTPLPGLSEHHRRALPLLCHNPATPQSHELVWFGCEDPWTADCCRCLISLLGVWVSCVPPHPPRACAPVLGALLLPPSPCWCASAISARQSRAAASAAASC